jgi:hypothetical protein
LIGTVTQLSAGTNVPSAATMANVSLPGKSAHVWSAPVRDLDENGADTQRQTIECRIP